MDKIDSVLAIRQVKQRMQDIRVATVHRGSVIHFGRRGRDEMVIVSARLWESLNSRNQARLSAAELPRDSYDVFGRALRTGRLVPTGTGARRRTQLEPASPLTIEQMIELGKESP
jgi:hypothetical protein